MTKPVTRKMAVDCLLWLVQQFYEGHRAQLLHLGDIIFCPICYTAILPEQDIQFDHRHADIFGGPHEYQNLRPVHASCHKKKTAQDIKDNAKIKRILGLTKTKPSKKIPARPFQSRKQLWPKKKDKK